MFLLLVQDHLTGIHAHRSGTWHESCRVVLLFRYFVPTSEKQKFCGCHTFEAVYQSHSGCSPHHPSSGETEAVFEASRAAALAGAFLQSHGKSEALRGILESGEFGVTEEATTLAERSDVRKTGGYNRR